MKYTQNQEKKFGIYQAIIDEAWKNESFKQELISNPKSSIEKVLGKKLKVHEDTKFVIEDQTNTDLVYLNIPRKPDLDNLELSDEQLEMVAGGIIFVTGTVALSTLAWIAAGTVVVGVGVGVGVAAIID